MATKIFYATRDLKNPGYGTRMLKAGDPVELDGPKSRLYLALGAVSASKPRTVRATPAAASVAEPVAAPTTRKPRRKAAAKK